MCATGNFKCEEEINNYPCSVSLPNFSVFFNCIASVSEFGCPSLQSLQMFHRRSYIQTGIEKVIHLSLPLSLWGLAPEMVLSQKHKYEANTAHTLIHLPSPSSHPSPFCLPHSLFVLCALFCPLFSLLNQYKRQTCNYFCLFSLFNIQR